jgi:hypothetical protein
MFYPHPQVPGVHPGQNNYIYPQPVPYNVPNDMY